MISYSEAIDYLYARLPMFTRDGASAFKKDLDNTLRLLDALSNPHHRLKTIHVAGTNGKGSTSHMLAAILQIAGYRTGLYTSPHLVDFRERIRIDGALADQDYVRNFVATHRQLIEEVGPSFFELTVAMAFAYFVEKEVDVVVVETGLGGRLDSTNVITPVLSLITNIGFDHVDMLGDTLPQIAWEKAGIIKSGVPVVVSERQEAVVEVFRQKSTDTGSALVFASDVWATRLQEATPAGLQIEARRLGDVEAMSETYQLDLKGSYQVKNLAGVLAAIDALNLGGFTIDSVHVHTALVQVQPLTGLMGRWQTVSHDPLVICDTGHNEDGWREVLANIAITPHRQLHVVMGVMRDKDLGKMLPLLPEQASYYFCQVDMPRALPAAALTEQAAGYGLRGAGYTSVVAAFAAANQQAAAEDLIFVGGSTFVVGDFLAHLL